MKNITYAKIENGEIKELDINNDDFEIMIKNSLAKTVLNLKNKGLTNLEIMSETDIETDEEIEEYLKIAKKL